MAKKKRLVHLFAVVLCGGLLSSCAAKAAKETRLTRVLVTGESDARVQPDTAVVVLSVVTQNQRALAAQQENARKTEAVIRAVREAAGGSPEIRTSDYSLQPEERYRYNSLPSIIGYEARNSVTVKLEDLGGVGAVIDAASRAGANSVEGVRFVLRETNPARGQALADATGQAMRKAESVAQSLGGRVVRVVESQEEGFAGRAGEPHVDDVRLSYAMRAETGGMALSKASPRTPVQAGPLDVRSRVHLTVEVESPSATQPR